MSVPWYLMAKGKGGVGYKTASGPIVSVSDALAAPLRSLVANIEPVQDLHGYANPWPAGGGKNKFDEDTVYSEYKQSDGSFLGRAGYINLISTPIPASCVGQQLTFSAMLKIPSGSIVTNIRVNAKVNGTSISGNAVNSSDYTKSSVTFTPTSASDTVNITFGSESGQNLQFKDIQLEIGSTATSFAPYSNICPISGWSAVNVWVEPTYDPTENPTATLQLGQTVYGGTLDVTNGVLTVDRAMVDLGTLSWADTQSTVDASGHTVYYSSAALGINVLQVPSAEIRHSLCSIIGVELPAKAIGLLNVTQTSYTIGNDNKFWPLFLDRQRTSSEVTSFFDGQTAVIPLATPITIPLTPTEISTLQGQNNVWADSGDVTIEYLSSGGANADLMKLAVAFMGRN